MDLPQPSAATRMLSPTAESPTESALPRVAATERLHTLMRLDPKAPEFLSALRSHRQAREIEIVRLESTFPEMIVTVPDAWPSIVLAPLYDVHLGSREHDATLFERHLLWFAETQNVLTWDGGDLIENASKLSIGASVFGQDKTPHEQLVLALKTLSLIQHKVLFTLPGNHEDRMDVMGEDMAAWLATLLEVPYFPDYCFCTIKWRGNNFRLLAHHGSGGAQTAGAQRNAARKDIAWARPFDLFWTGHLHQPIADLLYQTDQDQSTGRMVERNGFVMISPSYLHYFGGYGAKRRMTPGTRGLSAVELREDGRMDVSLHANGKRL